MTPLSVTRASDVGGLRPDTLLTGRGDGAPKYRRYPQLRNKPPQKNRWWYTCSFWRGCHNVCPRLAGAACGAASSGAVCSDDNNRMETHRRTTEGRVAQ